VKYEPSSHPYLTKFLVFGEGSGVSAPLRFPSFQIRSDLQDRMFFTCQVPGSQVRQLTQPRSVDLVSLLYVCMYVRGSRSMRRRDTMYISPAYVRTKYFACTYVCMYRMCAARISPTPCSYGSSILFTSEKFPDRVKSSQPIHSFVPLPREEPRSLGWAGLHAMQQSLLVRTSFRTAAEIKG
jgi:hypothetical protein